MITFKSLTAVAVFATASQALAGGLFAPISMDSATVMPKGIRSVRLAGFTSEISDKYDGNGQIVPLANSFNKSVSINKLINSRSSVFERGQLKGGLEADGVDLNASAGDTQGLVNTRLTTTIPVFAYGVTDRITVGFALPIMHAQTHVDTGWTASPYLQKTIDRMSTAGFQGKLTALKSDLDNVVKTQIAGYGYKPMEDQNTTDIGDLTLASKVLLHKDERIAVAIAPKVVVPTGRTPDIDKVVDVAPGDGHVSAGVGAAADIRLASNWTLTPSVGYTYQFSNDQAVRIPRSADESISPDKDWNVHKKVGDLMGGSLALKYRVTDLVTTGAGYSLQYKNPDSYEGGAYEPSRYHYLEQDTFQEMQAAQLMITGSTVPLYKAGRFALPLDGTFSFAQVFEGKNVGKIGVAMFELAAYF